jgi:hypothetical protein
MSDKIKPKVYRILDENDTIRDGDEFTLRGTNNFVTLLRERHAEVIGKNAGRFYAYVFRREVIVKKKIG